MKSVLKKDINGNYIDEGDRVIYCWSFNYIDGKIRSIFRIFTIKKVKAYHTHYDTSDDGDGYVRHLGSISNIWSGDECKKITKSEFDKLNIEEEVPFYFDDNNVPVAYRSKLDENLCDQIDRALLLGKH
jgi:hypothetical protein